MGKIIISQSDIKVEQLPPDVLILCILTLLLTWLGYSYISNGFKNGFKEGDLSMIVFAIVLTIISLWGAYVMIDDSQKRYIQQDTISQANSKVPYYELKKDGALIIAEKKSDAPDWLTDKVETKIISEDDTTYQVQFKNQYARIKKKDLK
jgi:hypothetical protein